MAAFAKSWRGSERRAVGSIQNGLSRLLISQEFLPKSASTWRSRRTLRNKRFFAASASTRTNRARSSCLRAAASRSAAMNDANASRPR